MTTIQPELAAVGTISASDYLDLLMTKLSGDRDSIEDFSKSSIHLVRGFTERYRHLNKLVGGKLSKERYLEGVHQEITSSVNCLLSPDPSPVLKNFYVISGVEFDFSPSDASDGYELFELSRRYLDRTKCSDIQHKAMVFVLQRISAFFCCSQANAAEGISVDYNVEKFIEHLEIVLLGEE